MVLMPYKIRRDGPADKPFCVYNTETGQRKGCSTTQAKAEAHIRAMYAGEAKTKAFEQVPEVIIWRPDFVGVSKEKGVRLRASVEMTEDGYTAHIPLGRDFAPMLKKALEPLRMDPCWVDGRIIEFSVFDLALVRREVGPFSCECLECGHTEESEEHCRDIACSECGGDMRREDRPGSGDTVKKSTDPDIDADAYTQAIAEASEVVARRVLQLPAVPDALVEYAELGAFPAAELGEGLETKARHRQDRCMECDSPPTVAVLWAEGKAIAWFCDKCFAAWVKADGRGEVNRKVALEPGDDPKKKLFPNRYKALEEGEGGDPSSTTLEAPSASTPALTFRPEAKAVAEAFAAVENPYLSPEYADRLVVLTEVIKALPNTIVKVSRPPFLERLREKLLNSLSSAVNRKALGEPLAPQRRVLVLKDGEDYRWVVISSTAFLDRHKEIVSREGVTKALARAQVRKSAGQDYGPFLFWHLPLQLGRCDFQVQEGVCLIESGLFDRTVFATKARMTLQEEADKWGASIGFLPFEGQEGTIIKGVQVKCVWTDIDIRERSLLPLLKAANPFASIQVRGGSSMDAQQEKALRQLVADDSFADEVVKRVDALNAKAASDPAAVHKNASPAPAPVTPAAPPATPVIQPVAQAPAPVAPPPAVTNVAVLPAPATSVPTGAPAPPAPQIDLMATLRAAGLAPGNQSALVPLTPAPVIPPAQVAQPVEAGVPQAPQVLNPVQQLDVLASQFKSTHPEVSAQLSTLVGTLGGSSEPKVTEASKAIMEALANMKTGLEAIGVQVKELQAAEAPMGSMTPPSQIPATPVTTVTKAAAPEYPKAVQGMANKMMGRS